MTDRKKTGDVVGDAVVEWYRSTLGQDDGPARAARARLRRCKSPVEALGIVETHELYEHLRASGKGQPTTDQLTLLATTFARLKGIYGDRLAVLFGKQGAGSTPRLLNELRFQSLIRIRSHRELIVPLCRSLGVLGTDPVCDGKALARDLFFWNESVRNDWCFQYFGATFAGTNQGEIVQ